jgi:signal peptidase I
VTHDGGGDGDPTEADEPSDLEASPEPAEPSDSSEESEAVETRRGSHGARWLAEWAVILLLALAAAYLLRTYCFQTFYIPSTSMAPTLQVGDRIVVSKLSVELGTIHRGDILVFGRPPQEDCGGQQVNDLVKRVVGLPNEYIKSVGNNIYWAPTPKNPAGPIAWHKLDQTWQHSPTLGTQPIQMPWYVIGPNQYYMLGDNHPESCDSRYWGAIPKSLIVGKVVFRIWPPSRIGFL